MNTKSTMYPLVSVCIPFGRNTSPDWDTAMFGMFMQPPMNAVMDFRRTINQQRDEAREDMSEESKLAKSKFVLMIDDDVTVPPYLIRKLLYAFQNQPKEVGVIAGIYCAKTLPAIPLVYQRAGEGPFYNWTLEEVFECEIVPAGMMMFRTEVLENMPKPWFRDISGVEECKAHGIIPNDFDGDYYAINDDGYFCAKVRQAGYKVMAHGGVLGIHWDAKGTAYLLPDNCYPIRMEMQRRYGNMLRPEQHLAAYQAIVTEYYGHADLLFPIPEEEECITTATPTKPLPTAPPTRTH